MLLTMTAPRLYLWQLTIAATLFNGLPNRGVDLDTRTTYADPALSLALGNDDLRIVRSILKFKRFQEPEYETQLPSSRPGPCCLVCSMALSAGISLSAYNYLWSRDNQEAPKL
jgi:hypothetical protein